MNCRHLLPTLRRLAALLIGALLIALLPAAHVAAQVVEPSGAHRADVHPLLTADLQAAGGPVSFLVVLRDQPDVSALLASGELQTAAAVDRRAALYAALTDHAARTQAPVRAWLDARGVPYTPHYLANMIEVQGDAALAEELRLRPEVDRLARNPQIRQAENVSRTPSRSNAWLQAAGRPQGFQAALPAAQPAATMAPAFVPTALPYGLTYTKADQVWALGIRGQGVVVAGQDTGVEWDHPALRNAYRGWDGQAQTATHAINWFDAFGRNAADIENGCDPDPQIPCDDQTHGTHTVGTMVGNAAPSGGAILGVAPDAEWVACRNMRAGVGTPASYTTCFEWFMAPYPQGGDPFRNGKPALAPDIINNSWGCPPSEGCDAGTLRQVVDTVRAAGLFVAASAGNNGFSTPANPNGCRTVQDPIGIYDSAFSVGAHDSGGNIAWFSSRGPVTIDGSNRLKPDITAPGVGTVSTLPTRAGGYGILSGTSMAAPHVAGAVALLWSAAPELKGDIERTEQILIKAATPVVDNRCDTFGAAQSPNNIYGYGRLDILAAVTLAQQPVTLTLTLQGSGGQTVAGRTVQLVDQRTGAVFAGITDSAGKAAWTGSDAQSALLAGTYDLWMEGCIGLTAVESITLAPGQTLSKTLPAANAACVALPQLYSR